MSQTMQLNQFNQTPILGNVASRVNLNVLPVAIDPNSTNTLYPGDAVYLTTTTANQIYVDKWASGLGMIFGFILYNLKSDSFIANAQVEIGMYGTIMFGQAGSTISRGQSLEYQPNASATGPQMLPSAGINPVSGLALDNASSTGIFRFLVLGPAEVNQKSDFTIPSTPATQTLNVTNGETQVVSATQSMTFNTAAVIPNTRLYLIITSATTAASTTISFGANFKVNGATLAVPNAIGKVNTIMFAGDGTNWNEMSRVSVVGGM